MRKIDREGKKEWREWRGRAVRRVGTLAEGIESSRSGSFNESFTRRKALGGTIRRNGLPLLFPEETGWMSCLCWSTYCHSWKIGFPHLMILEKLRPRQSKTHRQRQRESETGWQAYKSEATLSTTNRWYLQPCILLPNWLTLPSEMLSSSASGALGWHPICTASLPEKY